MREFETEGTLIDKNREIERKRARKRDRATEIERQKKRDIP